MEQQVQNQHENLTPHRQHQQRFKLLRQRQGQGLEEEEVGKGRNGNRLLKGEIESHWFLRRRRYVAMAREVDICCCCTLIGRRHVREKGSGKTIQDSYVARFEYTQGLGGRVNIRYDRGRNVRVEATDRGE